MAKLSKLLLMYPPSDEHLAQIQAITPQTEICIAHNEAEAQDLVVDVDAIFGNRYFLQSLPYAQNLKWMQSNSMGVDLILDNAPPQLQNIILTSAKGLYADQVADHALALLLGLTRGLMNAIESYQRREWGRWTLPTLAGMQALIIGWGTTGQAIGQRLQAFGMTVQGVRRSNSAPYTDETGCLIHTATSWLESLPEIDILVIATPLTAETRHLINAPVIAQLPKKAYIINIARGAIIDEQALLEALNAGKLAGAGLDTLTEEPPPPDHPIWTTPNLLLTPHVARSLEQKPYKWEVLFLENLRRYVHDEPLLNVVDYERGY